MQQNAAISIGGLFSLRYLFGYLGISFRAYCWCSYLMEVTDLSVGYCFRTKEFNS